jgi:hypothetical protein
MKGRNEIGVCDIDRADQHLETDCRFAASNVAAVDQHLGIAPDRSILEDFLQDRANMADVRSRAHSANYPGHLVSSPFDQQLSQPASGDVIRLVRTSNGRSCLVSRNASPVSFTPLLARDGRQATRWRGHTTSFLQTLSSAKNYSEWHS